MPHVLRLFRAPKGGLPMEELPEVAALEEVGFEDCAHAQPGGNARSCWWTGKHWMRWNSVQE
jgi:hypothetical protein